MLLSKFKQKIFYYKLNLCYDKFPWFGSKACKKKNFLSPQWLREVKAKKYPIYRIDTLFLKNKYMNINVINNGGWHFTQLKNPKDLEAKLMNQEHHDEYKEAKTRLPNIEDLIKRKTIIYDYKAKSTDYKFSKEFKLKTAKIDSLPKYLIENKEKYNKWFDSDD